MIPTRVTEHVHCVRRRRTGTAPGRKVWALAAPKLFFESVATFEPYNQHFVEDLGAFQIGLGAVLAAAIS